jgi:SNF2 family DNA or RNA helicase
MPHQEVGVRWLLSRKAGILADDMGLGKTFQIIGLLRNSPWLSTLILAPPVLIASWTAELRACGFGVSSLQSGVTKWTGSAAAATVCLATYPKAPNIADAIAAGRMDPFQRVILDEGHCIRNGEGTRRGSACFRIAADAESRWILSATPVQNSSRDWRTLCRWLGLEATDTATIMLRRTMDDLRRADPDAAVPPPPRFVVRELSVGAGPASSAPIGATASLAPIGATASLALGVKGAELRLFRALCDQLEDAMESSSTSGFLKLELYLRIQQFLVHPQIYIEAMRAKFGDGYPRPDWTGSTTKWTAFTKDLAASVADKEPVIVFCQFRDEMDRVAAAAAAMGASVWSIRGGMSSVAIGEAVNDGRAAAATLGATAATAGAAATAVVFIVQIISGGVGLNLQFCRRILFLSQHWNPAVVHQAVGRAVRIGSDASVEIVTYRICDEALDNLDIRMMQVHAAKIAAARDVCGSLYEGFPVPPFQEDPFQAAADAGVEV